MSFSNPMYLWGFLGILIPIAIHLWNKKEGKIIKIGSVKLLNESTSKKSSSIQFNELLLLLIRMLLISILVLIIGRPQIQDTYKNRATTYIIEPSLLTNENVTRILDTVSSKSTVRLLQKGLPEYQKNEVIERKIHIPNYWQLSKEIEAVKADSSIVFTRALFAGIKGKRPTTNKNITWIVITDENTNKKWIRAVKIRDSIALLSVASNTKAIYFEKKRIGEDNDQFVLNTKKDSIQFNGESESYSIVLDTVDIINIAIFYDDSLKDQLPFVEAVSNTVAAYLDRSVQVDKYQTNQIKNEYLYDLIVWLRKDSLPTISSKKIVYQPDPLANQLIETGDARNLFYLTEKLTLSNSIEEHFSEQFLEMLDLNQKVVKKISTYDKRSIAEAELIPLQEDKQTVRTSLQTNSSIAKWLWIFVCILLIVERIIAKYRKQ